MRHMASTLLPFIARNAFFRLVWAKISCKECASKIVIDYFFKVVYLNTLEYIGRQRFQKNFPLQYIAVSIQKHIKNLLPIGKKLFKSIFGFNKIIVV